MSQPAHQDERYLSSQPPPIVRVRGPLLSGWLMFFVISNLVVSFIAIQNANWLTLAWSTFGITCGVGVWLWYKFAFYGMLLGYGYNIAAALDTGSVQNVMFSLVFMGLTYFLVRQKWELFR